MTRIPDSLRDVTLRESSIHGLEVVRVARYFGRALALHNVSLEFRPGEVVAMLGPNGAGKTTLLRILATLLRPSEGAVRVNGGVDTWRARQRMRQHIGLVGHEALLYRELSGRENLALFARLYGVAERAIDDWLTWVGLGDAGDKPVGAYSRGMKQRLAIARALIHEPSLVLFDEPLTGLDRGGQDFLWGLLAWLKREGRLSVVVTHRFDAPRTVFDRVVVLDRGRVRLDDESDRSVATVYDEALSRVPKRTERRALERGDRPG